MSSDSKKIDRFVKAYYESIDSEITQSNDTFTITLPNGGTQEYTYQSALAREKKIPLIAPGSPAFQQILRDCKENGVLCQIVLKPKANFEALVRNLFRDTPVNCQGCNLLVTVEGSSFCIKPQPCHHRIYNGKIVSIKTLKTEPVRHFQFYYSVTFHNRLRPKDQETITILVEEKNGAVSDAEFSLEDLAENEAVAIGDFKSKIKAEAFEKLRAMANGKLEGVVRAKLALFDLPLESEKKAKLYSFQKRLRKERREQVISRKHDFDFQSWQTNFEALLKREEESYVTSVTVELTNLLVINTAKVKCEVTLDNHATIDASFILGLKQDFEVTCPICKKPFSEGYATKDGLYVCSNCIRQSVDTGKIYSKKAHLILDEKLGEYFEPDAGFICSVCGKKHSRLLEFKCSHDNSSVCISHYDLCDECGKIFSKANLKHTDEFKHQLCPMHAAKRK